MTLEKQESGFRLLADSLPQLVWIADKHGRITNYNARRAAYFAEELTDILKPQWHQLLHPDDLRDTISAWVKAMESAEDYEVEHRLRMADGGFRWHISRAVPVKESNGEVAAWFGSATDIQGLKQAAQASVERLQLATEAAAMFAWELDFETDTIMWAENAASVIGCPPGDLNERLSHGNFFVHPDDVERLNKEFNAARERSDERFELEFRGRPRVGLPVYWRAAGKFIRDRESVPRRAVGVTQDVTRHVESANQIRMLNERLSIAEEGARVLVYDWDLLANRVWRSDGVVHILGWKPEEISSEPAGWHDLIHPDDLARLKSLKESDYLDHDDHYTKEYRVRHKDGSFRWIMDTGRAFRDGAGRIIRKTGTTLDVTARKRSEIAQQRMANLIELSFEPIIVWHPKRGIVDWNKGAELLYGYSADEVLGKQPQTLLHTRYLQSGAQVDQMLNDTGKWTGEVVNWSKDGVAISVESRYQKIVLDDEALVLETNRDVRERKRADANLARMAAVAAASHDALYGATLDGIIEAWNPSAERLLGYNAVEVLGKHITMLADPSQHAEQLEFLKRVGRGETVRPLDTVRKRKDGRLIDVSIAMSPVTAADGTVIAISVALHDISERKEWNNRQLLMNRELAHRVKNSFAILQAILRSTLKSSQSPEQFAAAFSGRLHSLAAAHDVLTTNDWRGAELGGLLRQQLSHYVSGQRVLLAGTTVNLAAEQAVPLSLIINELATNAVKYGALSTPKGRIDIAWQTSLDAEGQSILTLTWRESGGPAVAAKAPRGFGRTLIEKSLAEAVVQMRFDPEGFSCTIAWPEHQVSSHNARIDAGFRQT